MGSQKEYPVKFTPRGLCDAWDASEAFPGACRSLQNLVFDQSNPELVVARPGTGAAVTSFSGFTTPTYISIQTVINGTVYGMVATGRTAGYDEPFAYNLTTNTFTTISGVTSANVPVSPATTGGWTPPTLAVVGSKILITHPGFSGTGANFIGVIDISTPGSPAWSSANTATHTLPSVPTAVVNFNNRAYYACGNALYYSDVLVPLTMTNAGQSLTLGDTSPITAVSGLPVQTTSAGVVGALIAFKAFQIWQITGDAAISGSLAENFLSLNVGCIAPRSVVQTPIGTIFAGIDGPYYVSALGQVLPLTKDVNKLDQDLQKPFQNIVNPSRAAAAFTGAVYRICMQTAVNGVTVTNDYWFDVTVRRWNGPHSFPYDCVTQYANYFLVSGPATGAALFATSYLPSLTSVYNDNGVALSVYLESCMFPKTQNINQKAVIETTMELASQSSYISYTINAIDDNGAVVGNAALSIISPLPQWGAFKWGDGTLWSASYSQPKTYMVPWSAPLVFKKVSIRMSATSSFYLSIGTMFLKYKDLGYTAPVMNES